MEICFLDHVQVPWESSCSVKREAVKFKSLPSHDDFFQHIFLKNQLCILQSTCTDPWDSRNSWVSFDGSPNFDYLKSSFGEARAPVADCNTAEFNSHPKSEMLVSDFIDYWQKYQADGHPVTEKCLYLKDWHFTKAFPSQKSYSPPAILCWDWLNEFCDMRPDKSKGDDYRFVYMGPKHTWTPFHSDVLRSYSWSANICGRKKWLFFPPGEEDMLRDHYGELVYDLRDPQLTDLTKYPMADQVIGNPIVVIQNPGEVVFVPSGWHHQVFNLEDTISINHNWVNGASVHLTWAFLKNQLIKVKAEISDCTDMEGFEEQCQKILKADSGMDYREFYNFLATIARHRIWALEEILHNEEKTRGFVNVQARQEFLCLWSSALNHSPRDSTASLQESANLSTDLDLNLFSSSDSTDFGGNDVSKHHSNCPMWAHCGPRLCVFDLKKTLAILKDLLVQKEWEVLAGGAEGTTSGDCALIKETQALMSHIQTTLASVKAFTLS